LASWRTSIPEEHCQTLTDLFALLKAFPKSFLESDFVYPQTRTEIIHLMEWWEFNHATHIARKQIKERTFFARDEPLPLVSDEDKQKEEDMQYLRELGYNV